jgi:hypothetical protein
MNFSSVKNIIIPDGVLKKITSGNKVIWSKKDDAINLWDLASRTGEKIGWNAASTAFAYDISKYYYPIARVGAFNQNGSTISNVVIGENSVSLVSSASLYGIAVPFTLDSAKQYRIKMKLGSNTRLDMLNYNASNVYQSYTNIGLSGDTVDYTFTPTAGAFTVFGLLSSSSNATLSYTDISLTEA